MTSFPPPSADDFDDSRPAPGRTADLTAVVVERDSDCDECTIYPRDVSDDDLVTRWISAEEDSYVSLDEMR